MVAIIPHKKWTFERFGTSGKLLPVAWLAMITHYNRNLHVHGRLMYNWVKNNCPVSKNPWFMLKKRPKIVIIALLAHKTVTRII